MDLQQELKTVEEKAQKAINDRKLHIDAASQLEMEVVKLQGEHRALKRLLEPEKPAESTTEEPKPE